MVDNRENNKWIVYVHIVPKEISDYDYDKYYVGITGQTVERRWRENGTGYYTQPFYKAIKKYGWNNIEHYIIAEHITEKEAQELEKALIKALDCNINKGEHGYNISDGGEGQNGYKHSEETKRKIAEANKGRPYTQPWDKISPKRREEIRQEMKIRFSGENNPRYGKHCTNETKEKISKANKGQKRVNAPQCIETYQFDTNFNYVNKYYSISDAARICNLKHGNIYRCIKNQQYSHGGYIWRSKENIENINNIYKPINLPKKSNINRKIYQFDIDGNYITSYKKLIDIINYNKNFKICNISRCLNYGKSAYNYIWKYEDDVDIVDNKPKLREQYKRKVKTPTKQKTFNYIYQFDINGNFIKKYSTCVEAGKDNKIDNSYIGKAAKKIRNTAGGYMWRYEKDVGFTDNGKAYFIA